MAFFSKLLHPLCLLIGLLLFTACNKKETAEPQGDGIVGRWDLQKTSGGLTGAVTNVSPGTRQLDFAADGTVRLYERGTLANTQQYSVERGTAELTGQPADVLFFISPGVRSTRQTVQVTADALIIQDDYTDGLTYQYRRL